MATIRIPAAAEPLLTLCRTSGSDGPYLWETYADMLAFLAAYAYAHSAAGAAKPAPLRGANPIDLGTFRSRGLYALLLTLAIAERRDWLVAKEPNAIAQIAERFAAAGAMLLCPDGLSADADSLARMLVNELHTGGPSATAVTI